ncbi:fimbrial biogenesis chaperone [Roseicella aerolata]|uniref:Fimbria/pilus periplasmic chaperone n=1 Tax=Roseicella aerolata TaxID=2883479 RepID=A0A9X1L8X8_9PROT|nr:fimbria/pilus periplasmic chaperone [Roseicella aerolata]MCB4823541.1 fimbria/pilus periplasmic chaperone [Roseicella aerolata]
MVPAPRSAPRRAALGLVLAAAGCLLAPRRAAAATRISPTLLDFAPGQMAGLLEFANLGDGAISIDIDIVAWTQRGDEDILAPSEDIVVSPPAAVIPAGARQTLRVIFRRRPEGEGERSYRLLIAENPVAPDRNRTIAVAVTHSLPVFMGPALGGGQGRVQWRAERSPEGGWDLVAANPGQRYIRIQSLSVLTSRAQQLPVEPRGRTPYVLPGVERRWRLPRVPAGIDSVLLRGQTQSGPFEQTVTFT